jgi:hypothetical protein
MPQGLVIAADTTGGFSMSVYDNDQVVQQPDGSFLPIQNGHPFAIWTVTRVGGDPNIIQVQETAGKTFFYTNSSGTGWKQCGLRNPDGSYSINRVLATIS